MSWLSQPQMLSSQDAINKFIGHSAHTPVEMDSVNRGLDLEKELTCSICTEVLYQPLTLLDCLHTFCGACLKEWFSWQLTASRNNPNLNPPGSSPYTCPSCRATVRETKHNATVTTLLEMFLAANPEKGKSAEEKESLKEKYTPGEEVMPKVEHKEKTLRERRVEDEDRRLMSEVRDLSLREVGVGAAEARNTRRRRDEDRLQTPASRSSRGSSRESRSAEGREYRRPTEGNSDGERRRRRDDMATSQASTSTGEEHRRRRSQEDGRRRQEQTSRTAARQIEHQSSLRSLISSSDIDSHELQEEILRQIQEEGLLDGIDLDLIDVNQQDQLSERIAEAYRRRHLEISRTSPARSTDGSPAARSGHSGSRDHSSHSGQRASSRQRTHSRSTSATSQADEQSRSTSHHTSTHLDVHSADERRHRRRTTSSSRSATSPAPVTDSEATRPAARSQTDLSNRPRSSQRHSESPSASSRAKNNPEAALQRQVKPPSESSEAQTSQQQHSGEGAQVVAIAGETTTKSESSATTSRSAPPTPISVPAATFSTATVSSPVASLIPAALSPRHQKSASASDRTILMQSSARPTSSSSATSRVNLPRFPEPFLTCARCAKPHIEYELHYNCSKCSSGNWNICLSCYRAGLGCLHWFGFGYAAWASWERLKLSENPPLNKDQPHMLTVNRYLPPTISPGGADGRRTITTEDPRKRLQSGAFCANCLTWANDCYWRCDLCNEGDWGFCHTCVNQGKCCTHPLLPLTYSPVESATPPLSPTLDLQTPSSAVLLTGPGIVEFGAFKPMTFKVNCDICRHLIPPTSNRYHCFSCTSYIPGSKPGDYDICMKCYDQLESRKIISFENGQHGWRRCPKGHRITIVGFEDDRGGRRRTVVQDLVGGRSLKEEPLPPVDHNEKDLQQWSWEDGSQLRLVTTSVSASAPLTWPGMILSTKFPPPGGLGMSALVLWPWYPEVEDELLFPKGAELRECVDVNGDWFWGVYMGAKGLFPAPYVRILDNGPFM